ncbi:MAG: carboxypeptidase-like regulatory domain-containing protein [Ilumatobacteraceae bacterium]
MPLRGATSYLLTGTLTLSGGRSNGVKLVGARVSVYDALTGRSLQTITSTTGGAYTITLAPGSYKLFIQPNRGGYVNQWYGGTSLGTAVIINVAANATLNIPVHP